jgi:large subunit ribosomal protein L24e
MSKAATSLRNCFFCGRHITIGHGIMLLRSDGQVQWKCSSKCKKNLRVLQRDPRKLKWTERYAKGGLRTKK